MRDPFATGSGSHKKEREDAKHIAWLNRTIAHLEQSDPDFHRAEISALQRALGVGRPEGRPVDIRASAESDAEYAQSRGGK